MNISKINISDKADKFRLSPAWKSRHHATAASQRVNIVQKVFSQHLLDIRQVPLFLWFSLLCYTQVCWGVLGTRFGSLEFQIGSLESEKIIIGSLK